MGDKRKMRGKAIAAFVFLAALSLANPARAAERKLTLGVFIESTGGRSSSETFDFINIFLEVFAKETGYEVKMKKFSSHEEVGKAFAENKIDAAYLNSNEVVKIIDGGGGVFPVASYVIDKERKYDMCLWRRKGSAVKELNEVVGRTFMESDPNVF